MEFEVNDQNFDEKVIEKSKEVAVIVDYWAEWCMPCRMLGPILEKVVKEFEGKVVLAKLNVDENPVVSSKFAIMSIPSVKMFKDGKVVDEFVGVVPEFAVRDWVKHNVGE